MFHKIFPIVRKFFERFLILRRAMGIVRLGGTSLAVRKNGVSAMLRPFLDPVGTLYEVDFLDKKVSFRSATTDYNELMFIHMEWNLPDILLTKYASKSLVLVDCGCSIGLSTIKISEQLNFKSIVCIDPTRESLELAKHNLSYIQSVMFHQVALGGVAGQATLSKLDELSPISFRTVAHDKGQIQVMTLNQIWEHHKLSGTKVILKLDIEGGEYSVFSKEADLSWLNSVEVLMLEFHEDASGNEMIRSALKSAGFNEMIREPTWSVFGLST